MWWAKPRPRVIYLHLSFSYTFSFWKYQPNIETIYFNHLWLWSNCIDIIVIIIYISSINLFLFICRFYSCEVYSLHITTDKQRHFKRNISILFSFIKRKHLHSFASRIHPERQKKINSLQNNKKEKNVRIYSKLRQPYAVPAIKFS